MDEVEILGKELVKSCGGLPLAVVILGGILSTKINLSEWKNVHDNIKSYIWNLKNLEKDKCELEKMLALSYCDLPFKLKPCFLYLSCFPEDAEIFANTLYQLWIAEGLVLAEDLVGEESMMELAERYLCELGQRGMVKLQTYKWPVVKRFESCQLHDLMRDFCLRKAEQERFLKSMIYSSTKNNADRFGLTPASSNGKFRRFVINLRPEDVNNYSCCKIDVVKYLRMVQFLLSDERKDRKLDISRFQLKNFEMLRSLSIEKVGYFPELRVTGSKWFKAIGKLIHLRYLRLRGLAFDKLPSSLGNLRNLQTLDLQSYSYGWMSPNILLKMKELTCLYFSPFHVKEGCRIRLDGLEKLEIIKGFDDRCFETKDLMKLSSLRELEVWWCASLESLKMIADYAHSSRRLEHVSIESYCDMSLEKEKGVTVVKQLLFGRNIHSLGIYGKMWKFPEYESNISSNLITLRVIWSGLNVEEGICTSLEKLPHLRQLELLDMKGKEMRFHAMGFPQLQRLWLQTFPELEKWVVEEGAMSRLCTLTISECPELEAIPDGLRSITTLEQLQIREPAKFIERIWGTSSVKGEDFHKISHVPLITHLDIHGQHVAHE